MTLHNAIRKVLTQKGQPMTTKEIAHELNENGLYEKKDKSEITDYQVHGRTKNYPLLFKRDGAIVSLV